MYWFIIQCHDTVWSATAESPKAEFHLDSETVPATPWHKAGLCRGLCHLKGKNYLVVTV